MADIDAKTVMALRKQTGAPMMDCKAALQEVGGDVDAAVQALRKKGLQTADKKADRDAAEGAVFSYVHHNGRLGVLVEIACETDFVARNEAFQQFGKDVCFHVAAMNPESLTREEVSSDTLAKERDILTAQARETMEGKPDEIIEKAVEGRMKKFFAERCLMEQPFVKDDADRDIETVRRELVGKIGENIQIKRFTRFELGG